MSLVTMNCVSNNIKQGTTLITAEPFAFLLNAKYRTERCDYCFKSCKVSRCSGCQYVYYCSRNCQKLAWTIHKVECPCIKKVHPKVAPDAARMMARIIIKLNNGGGNERGYYTPTKYRKFDDLMTHVDDIKKDMKKFEHYTCTIRVLLDFLPENLLPKPERLLDIFGRMIINSFHILDNDMASVGVGIYLGPSIVDHSCKPNAIAVFDGTTIIIKSQCEFKFLDWSKIYISYINTLQDTKTRRAELKKSYYFHCKCERCNAPELMGIAAACPNKNCTNPCLPTDVCCNKCGEKFPDDFEENYETICELTNYNLDRMADVAYLDVCKMSLKQQEGVLHPFNLLTVHMLESALAAAIHVEHWKEAEEYASQLIPRYIYYHGEVHPVTGHKYFSWAKILLLLTEKEKELEILTKAAEILMKAAEILKITLGENHTKMTEEVKPLQSKLMAELIIRNRGSQDAFKHF